MSQEQNDSPITLENEQSSQEKTEPKPSKSPKEEDKLHEAVEARARKILNRKEEILWRGTPRHTIMFKYHAVSFLMIAAFSYLGIQVSAYFFILLAIPFVLSTIKILEIKSNVYEITNKRLKIKKGIFSRVTNEIELYDIKNTTLEEKRGNKGFITFYTTNEKFPRIKFPRMQNPSEIHNRVRDIYEELKLERNKITHSKSK
ncbi:MAG: PH domain-containing protein [Campylobacterales bacterium]|nr:PH domain-containing protein [Campylobacterales bacterium]